MDSLCHPCTATTHLSYNSVLSLKLPRPPCAALLVSSTHKATLSHTPTNSVNVSMGQEWSKKHVCSNSTLSEMSPPSKQSWPPPPPSAHSELSLAATDRWMMLKDSVVSAWQHLYIIHHNSTWILWPAHRPDRPKPETCTIVRSLFQFFDRCASEVAPIQLKNTRAHCSF